MLRRLAPLLSSRSWRRASGGMLTLLTLALIVWAGVASGQLPLLHNLSPVVVALGFWTTGLLAWYAGQRRLISTFFLLFASTLAAGKLTALDVGGDLVRRLFYLGLAWLAPLTLHGHLALLDRPAERLRRTALRVLYGLAAAWSLPFLLWTTTTLEQRGWMSALRPAVRLTFATGVASSALSLLGDYGQRASLLERRRIRLVIFGFVAGFAPFLLLALLPDTLGAPARVPYEWTFPWLLFIPLAYVYALFRDRLTPLEVALNRAAVYYLLITVLLSVYLVAVAVLNRFTADLSNSWPLASALLSVGLLLLFMPLYKALQRLVRWVLYGSDISYAGVVTRLTDALAVTLDRTTLRSLLTEDLAEALRLSASALFIRERSAKLRLVGASGFGPDDLADRILGPDLVAYLEERAEPIAGAEVNRALVETSLQAAEQQLPAQTDVAFWVPLVSAGTLQGLLLVGPKRTEEYFTTEDERILRTVAIQAGLAAHNVRLMEEVRDAQRALARAHQQLLVSREREQRRLAHELHDNAVQQLLGIRFLLSDIRREATDGLVPAVEEARQEVLKVVKQLRGQIRDLRPAGLEKLGLSAALDGYAARLRREGGPGTPVIKLDLDDDSMARLPEAAEICLFRAAQEGLRNALKHAGAQHVRISLRLEGDEAVLRVRDDGRGFQVPARLNALAKKDHFGLLGVAERAAWTGGELTVRSRPGDGTELVLRVPMEEPREKSGTSQTG